MSNPLSPLSPSYQNSRSRSSPKMGSSPFLTEFVAPDTIPSSPLKQTWTDRNAQTPRKQNYSPNENENDENFHPDLNANDYDDYDRDDGRDDDFEQDPASSPFRPDARDDTVDFQKLREYQQATVTPRATATPRHKFGPAQAEDPMSSPFRPDAHDEDEDEFDHEYNHERETEDLQQLRDAHPLSPGLDKRLALDDPASSPFRPNARDAVAYEYENENESVDADYQQLRDVEPLSPGLDKRLALDDPASSPFRPEVRDETVDFAKLREMQRLSPDVEEQLGPESSPFRANVREDRLVDDFDEEEGQEGFHQGPHQSIGGQESPSPPPVDEYESPARLDVREDAQETEFVPEEHSRQSLRQSVGGIRQRSPAEQSSPLVRNVQDYSNEAIAAPEEPYEAPRPRESVGRVENSPSVPVAARSSLSKQRSPEEALEVQKLRSSRRSLHRTSLGVEGRQSFATTPRKRSFDETPRGQEEAQAQAHESCKKGMVSRPEIPDIHVDIEEESSVIHNESLLSMTSAMRDQSTIANSMMEDRRNEGMSTFLPEDENAGADENSGLGEDYHDSMDETGLSSFSVLPDMTTFAKLRADSPLKSMRGSLGHGQSQRNDMYRQSVGASTPGTARRSYSRANALHDTGSPTGSPTPRRRPSRDFENSRATPNLLDFGDSVNFFPHQSVQQGGRYSPSRRSPMRPMRQSIRSPSKFSSLLDLDYEMAPAPTPRSLPSITPRELESLKSGFMSEISSLKATLSGKDAEVASLKTAISDAERRVGEALEEVRNEAGRREALEMEQAEWDRRGNEMESVLRSVRSELVEGEHERERLIRRADEADKSKESLEGRVVELESQLSAARSAVSSGSNTTSSSSARQVSQSAEATAREVQDAVEKVARELHTLYKGKHETKVAALKKSYESRWEKRLREVEKKLKAANEEQNRLRGELETAQNDNMVNANASMIAREFDEYDAEKRVFEAQIEGLQHEMASLKEDSQRLRSDLELERAEKGDLVAAVDEWLAIQQTQTQSQSQSQSQSQVQPTPQHEQTRDIRETSISSAGYAHGEEYLSSTEESSRRSVSRSGSGIRPPVTGEKRSRFGAPAGAGHSRGNSGGKSGIAMYTPGRGGIMSSIERMGRGGV